MSNDARAAGHDSVSLASFTPAGYDKGRPKWTQALWFATQNLVSGAWWCPGKMRPIILRAFGANIGERVFIRHRVRVLWPWKLTVAADCWIGEDVWLLNLERISIGSNICLSQGAFSCTGSHKPNDPSFAYDNGPIVIGEGAWIAARATVLRGVTVGADALVGAGSVVTKDVGANSVVLGYGRVVGDRWEAA